MSMQRDLIVRQLRDGSRLRLDDHLAVSLRSIARTATPNAFRMRCSMFASMPMGLIRLSAIRLLLLRWLYDLRSYATRRFSNGKDMVARRSRCGLHRAVLPGGQAAGPR